MANKIVITPEELRAQAASISGLIQEMDSLINTFANACGVLRQAATGECRPYDLVGTATPIVNKMKDFRTRLEHTVNLAADCAGQFENVDQALRNNTDPLHYELPKKYWTSEVKNAKPSEQKVYNHRMAKIIELMETDTELNKNAAWPWNKGDYKEVDMKGTGCYAAAHAFQKAVEGSVGGLWAGGKVPYGEPARGKVLDSSYKLDPALLQPGDVIHYYRLNPDGTVIFTWDETNKKWFAEEHWVYIYGVNGNELSIAEGNAYNGSETGMINYRTYDKTRFAPGGDRALVDIHRV